MWRKLNNFEITKSISNTIKEAGEIEQLSSRSRLTTRKRPPVKVKKKRTAPIRFRGRRKKCSNTLE